MIFNAVRAVLMDLDEAGDDTFRDWDERVEQQIESLANSYGQLRDPTRTLIDYSTLPSQAAYVFMYVAGHAEFIYQILAHTRQQQPTEPLFDAATIRVTSMGGGPGSELLGLLKYLSEHPDEPVTDIIYTVVDKEANWEHVAELLINAADSGVSVQWAFKQLDVTDLTACLTFDWSEEDLVLMSFFISEVCALPNSAEVRECLNHLFRTLRTGAILIYNDSNAYSFYKYFNYRTSAAGKYDLVIEVQKEFTVSGPDLSGIFEEYMDRTGRTPKLNSNALAKVMVRT